MLNYIYGAVTTISLITMVEMIDSNVPNNLWYWLDLYLPF